MKSWQRSLLVLLGFLVVGLLIYAPVLNGEFQFDDKRVVMDPAVRDRRDLWGFLKASVSVIDDNGGFLGTRSLVHASFLANWILGGEDTTGYHLVNLGVHVITSFLVFWLVRQILWFVSNSSRSGDSPSRSSSSGRPGSSRDFWLAVLGGLVFLMHPLQSQAVAYIAQRFVSIATMFYLLAVVLYLEARKMEIITKPGLVKLWLYAGSWMAALAAASSKEMVIVLPILLLLLEWLIIGKRGIRGMRWWVILVYFLIVLKIPAQIFMGANQGRGITEVSQIAEQITVVEKGDSSITRGVYFLTQTNVLKTYIRLMLVPVGQSIDYDYPVSRSIWQWPTWASLGVHLLLLALAVDQYKKKNKLVTFAILWFYLSLAVTSSVIPIRDVIYEHRAYLALVSYVLVLVFLIQKLYDRYTQLVQIGVGLLIVVYGFLTLARSTVWATELTLWQDAWEKAPDKARTNKNYGFVLTENGKLKEGVKRLERAIELKTDDQNYFITLGAAYLRQQRWDKALAAFERAIELDSTKADGWNNKGVALFHLGDYQGSRDAFEGALEQDDEFFMAWTGLGGAEMMLGNTTVSEKALKKAIELEPEDPGSRSNIVSLYILTEQWEKARDELKKLELINPSFAGLQQKKTVINKNLAR